MQRSVLIKQCGAVLSKQSFSVHTQLNVEITPEMHPQRFISIDVTSIRARFTKWLPLPPFWLVRTSVLPPQKAQNLDPLLPVASLHA